MNRIFRLAGMKASALAPSFFASRDALRKIVEGNLDALFGLTYLESDFHLVDLPPTAPREIHDIDTLAYDTQNHAPVAIEYRERISAETAAQGVAILQAIPTQAQILKYMIKRAGFNPDVVEWRRTRVLFIAREVLHPAIISSRTRAGGIELWECSLYQGDILHLDHIATFPTQEQPAGPGAMKAEGVAAPAEDFSL